MSTYVLVHGAGDVGSSWDGVVAGLHGRDQAAAPMREPWPLDAWPDVPTRYLLCREDRFFPADWTRQMVHTRLGMTPDEIDGGHCPFLSRPYELAERLVAYRTDRDREEAASAG